MLSSRPRMLLTNIDATFFSLLSPPGPYSRRLALTFAALLQLPYELVSLHRDIGEADLLQSRNLAAGGSLVYHDGPVVRAMVNGGILILEGAQRAERNILPLLNNILEVRRRWRLPLKDNSLTRFTFRTANKIYRTARILFLPLESLPLKLNKLSSARRLAASCLCTPTSESSLLAYPSHRTKVIPSILPFAVAFREDGLKEMWDILARRSSPLPSSRLRRMWTNERRLKSYRGDSMDGVSSFANTLQLLPEAVF